MKKKINKQQSSDAAQNSATARTYEEGFADGYKKGLQEGAMRNTIETLSFIIANKPRERDRRKPVDINLILSSTRSWLNELEDDAMRMFPRR